MSYRGSYVGVDGSPLRVGMDYFAGGSVYGDCAKIVAATSQVATNNCGDTGMTGKCQKPSG